MSVSPPTMAQGVGIALFPALPPPIGPEESHPSMGPDRIRMLLRWCRGRELGIGKFSRTLTALSVQDNNLGAVRDEVYSRNSTAVAFHAVARAMAYGSDNVADFEQVLDQLGPARVRKAALAGGLIASVPEGSPNQVFDYACFQKRCLFVAFVLEALSQRMDLEIAPEAFIVGLLMDGSYLLMLEHFESDFELSLYSRITNPSLDATQAEEMYMGISSAQIASVIAEDTRLSKCAIETLSSYRDPGLYEGRFTKCVDVCHLTAVIADYAGFINAPGLPYTSLNLLSLKRLELRREYWNHISNAVEYAREVSSASVSKAVEAVLNVRRFAAVFLALAPMEKLIGEFLLLVT